MPEKAVAWSRQRNSTSVVAPAVILKTFVVMFGPEGSGKSGLLATVVFKKAPMSPSVRFPVLCEDDRQLSFNLLRDS